MTSQGIDPQLLDVLNRASSLQLFQLSTLIERLLADPRRIIAVRTHMHMGQTVRFLDWRDGQMRQGKVVAMKDTQVTLQDVTERREWKLPYAAIEPPPPGSGVNPKPSAPPSAAARPTRADFSRGDKVSFTDRHLQTHIGIITRCNPKTASVDTGGESWGVPYGGLRHVLDIG